jgi:hypothetical protein
MHYRQKRYVLPHTPFDQGCLFGGLQYVSTGLGAETSVHCGILPANQHFLRADEWTRTAYPCSLRVCGQWLLRVALACKSRINRRLLFPRLLTIAGYCVWVRVKSARITRRRFLCKSVVASSRGSAELTRRSPHKRLPPPCRPPRPIHHSGHPCRANTCSVDFYA